MVLLGIAFAACAAAATAAMAVLASMRSAAAELQEALSGAKQAVVDSQQVPLRLAAAAGSLGRASGGD